MSRTVARTLPIMPYGLDVPFTTFSKAAHDNYMFDYSAQYGQSALKFFKTPVYVHTHATVRKPVNQWGKITFSILPDEADFIRSVESDVFTTLDRIVGMAEPGLSVDTLPFKSVTYENLVQLKVAKSVGQDKDGLLVHADKHETVLVQGVKVLMTLEIYGLYHSPTGKGVISRIHCYRVVDTF